MMISPGDTFFSSLWTTSFSILPREGVAAIPSVKVPLSLVLDDSSGRISVSTAGTLLQSKDQQGVKTERCHALMIDLL